MASTINAKNTSTGVVITPDASGQLELQTADTTRMTIDVNGNVGIGTSSPTNYSGYKTLAISGSTGGVIDLMSGSTVVGELFNTATDVRLQNNTANPVQIWTNGSERMRIDSAGNVFIANTGLSSGKFQLYNSGGTTAYSQQIFAEYASGTGYFIEFIRRNSGVNNAVGGITASTTTTTYSTSSDYRLKDNVTPMSGALSTVAQLNPVTYTWRADGSSGQGFIAHELQSIIPDAVVGEKDAVDADGNPVYQGIDTSFLVATLTAAIQELKAELDTVKAELATLKGEPS